MIELTERQKELLTIAQDWAESTLDDWIGEYGAWDGFIEDDTLSLEEWEWIRKHVRFDTEVRTII